MMREDLVVEISMRTDVPIEDVEDVLEEQDIILEEERKSKGVKKCIIVCSVIVIFLMGALATLMMLDKKVERASRRFLSARKSSIFRYANLSL